MRITNSMMSQNMLKNLNQNMIKMNKYQIQMATNSRITKLSDDPVGVTQSLQARNSLERISQYKKNALDANSMMTFTETALMDMGNYITRAYELVIDSSNATKSPSERQAIAVEIEQIKEQCIQTLNTTCSNKYIFGGNNTANTPFTQADGEILYNGENILLGDTGILSGLKDQGVSYKLGKGIEMEISMNGLEVVGFGADNILNQLDELKKRLDNDLPVTDYITKLNDAKEHILSLVSEIGGKSNRLDHLIARYENDLINYKGIQSRVEEIDQAEVITQFKMQEAVYRTALSVGARVIQPSLMDFLR